MAVLNDVRDKLSAGPRPRSIDVNFEVGGSVASSRATTTLKLSKWQRLDAVSFACNTFADRGFTAFVVANQHQRGSSMSRSHFDEQMPSADSKMSSTHYRSLEDVQLPGTNSFTYRLTSWQKVRQVCRHDHEVR